MATTIRAKRFEVKRIAESQHGIVTRAQALAAGYSDSAIGRLIEAGYWRRVRRGVYSVLTTSDPYRARLMVLVLRAPDETWASHRAAAALWRLDGIGGGVLEVSTTADLRSRSARVHRVAEMPVADRRELEGIPVTSVERTLADLGAVVTAGALVAATVDALRRNLTTIPRLRARVAALAVSGRAGPRHIRALLDEWQHPVPPESVLEARLQSLLRRHALPDGIRQLEIRDGAFAARLDLAYPAERVGVEVDGFMWHSDPARWRADLARSNRLTQLGWHVLHFTWRDIDRDPARVAGEIRAALAGRRRVLSGTPPD